MRFKNILNLAFVFCISISALAGNSHHEHNGEVDIKSQIKETISHHLKDSYDFTITHGVSFPLPVILIDGGLHVFMSSKFHHGETVAESNGNYYKIFHSKIYKVDGPEGEIILDDHHHATNDKPLDFSITKNVFVIMLMCVFMFFVFKGAAKGYQNSQLPQKSARFLEPIILYIRDEIGRAHV